MGQEHGELVAANPERAVCPTEAVAEELTETAQDPIAAGVPLSVVDSLELVEVNEQER